MAETTLPLGRTHHVDLGVITRLALLPAVLILAMLLALFFGTVTLSPTETLQILLHRVGLYTGRVTWPATDEAIIWSIRLPRVLAAALVGAALGVAGTLFQAVLRNPLADPYIIGTSAGAQLGVSIMLLVPIDVGVFGFGPVQVAAFCGATVTVLFVYGLARTRGRTPVVTLLLAGFVVSSFLISLSSFLISVSNHMTQIMNWTMGSVDVSEFSQLGLTGPLVIGAALLAFALAHQMDVVLLGEAQAAHLGIRVERLKIAGIVLGALLTALAVSLAGVVPFVGLIVPHTARLLYGPAHRILVPTAALGGALFVVLVDLIARTVIAPTEIPLGVMTAVVGSPFFLHLLRRSRRDYAV
ncbi:MAG: iron ABC transporter permease [Chloroflexota bacterium]|nr:iron ABC transporter permease [Chloroflexota bacterium]